jgi:transposase-like protein
MRQAAEEAIGSGASVARVCRMYGLSRDQWRHHKDHRTVTVPGALATVRMEVLEGGGGPYTLIPRLEVLLGEIAELKEVWADRPSILVQLLRLERDVLGDVAKLRGEFPDKPLVTLDQIPQWGIVLAVLDNHPRARLELVEALSDGS